MSERPESAADPRPNNEPYYIDSSCPECGTDLVLEAEHAADGDIDEDEIWHDEWVCPNDSCKDVVYMDVPAGHVEKLKERKGSDGDWLSLEMVEAIHGLNHLEDEDVEHTPTEEGENR